MQFFDEQNWVNLDMDGETIEECQFTDCTFTKCRLMDVKLISCDFHNCTFVNCVIGNPQIRFTTATSLKFHQSMLVGIDWQSLRGTRKEMPLPPFLQLQDCVLRYHYFSGFRLDGFDFRSCTMEENVFTQCSVKKTDFRGIRFGKSRFSGCDLRGADFREATEYVIDIRDCQVKEGHFSFPEVVNLLAALEIHIH